MNVRNDDLVTLQQQLGGMLTNSTPSINPGWLQPEAAYAFYTQNGVIGHIVGRIATLMTKSSWVYKNADVAEFNWATVQSRHETLRTRSAMEAAAIFWIRDGGGAVEAIVDDAGGDRSQPLVKAKVRKIRKLKAWSAYNLRPEPGKDYSNTATFIVRGEFVNGKPLVIHRSRLSIVVGGDVVPGARQSSTVFINSSTGWPPSWLEGIYRSHTDWRSNENDISQRVHTGSLLHIALNGYRAAMNGASDDEKDEVTATLQAIVDTLASDGVLFTDSGDTLEEIGRAMTGMSDVIINKRLTFLADTGLPQELVLMVAAGNLGDNSGPVNAFYDTIDGKRVGTLTPVVEDVTDLLLIEEKRKAAHHGEVLEIPTEYTTEWGAIAEPTDEAKAKSGKDEAARRKSDWEIGTPFEVIATDPTFQATYPGLAQWMEEQEEARRQAAAIEATQPQPPDDDLVAASAIALKLGVSAGKIRSMIMSGEIPGRKIGSRWKASMKAVWAALEEAQAEGRELGEETEDRVPRLRGRSDVGRSDVAYLDDAAHFDLALTESTEFGGCFGASDAMREIFTVLERIAPSPLAVLITGETGTGKEGIARGLHQGAGQFVAINCGALPDDPAKTRALLARAVGEIGTVFLDEVGELSPVNQAAVLRVLAGDAKARIVSATHRDLRDASRFRLDLLMRLAGVEVEIPPLRDREEDVFHLAELFAAKAGEESGRPLPDPLFAADALAALKIYQWPGNVRELKTAIERALWMAEPGEPLAAEHMQLRLRGAQ